MVKEANAIGTTWLRAGVLPEVRREQAKRLLSDFVDVRLRTHAITRDPIELVEGLRRSAEIESKLWQYAEESVKEAPTSVTTSLLLPLTITLVFLLIFDLTHERQGIIGISQQPLIDLQGLIRSGPESRQWSSHRREF